MMKIIQNKKSCDSCGKPFKGISFPIINENFIVQKGLIQCEKCYKNQIEK